MDLLNTDLAANSSSSRASVFSDINSLNHIRETAISDSRAAIKSAAKEFEAFFMNMMLKSMRQASEVLGNDSMFGSPQEKMFTGMLDEQMSVELSQKGNLGIADLMVRDLLGEQLLVRQETASFQTDRPMPRPTDNDKYYNDVQPRPIISQLINTPAETSPMQEKLLSVNEQNKTPSLTTLVEPIKKVLFQNAKTFVETLTPFAQKMAEKLGVDPRVLLAQSALETGWGKHVMHNENNQSSNNLFGIKSTKKWQGESVKINTLEVEKNEVIKKKEDFRMYANLEQSFSDYVDLVKESPRYKKALEVVHDAKKYLEQLQKAGYATDPNYANKILKIFDQDIIQNAPLRIK